MKRTRGLLVCRSPASEAAVFGGLLMETNHEIDWEVRAVFLEEGCNEARFLESCKRLGAVNARHLGLVHPRGTRLHLEYVSNCLGELGSFDVVSTHGVQGIDPLTKVVGAAVGARRKGRLLVSAAGGIVDRVVRLDPERFATRLRVLSECYPDHLRLDRIDVTTIRSVDLFQEVSGDQLAKYYRNYSEWRLGDCDSDDPWDLKTSEYERLRHGLELDTLSTIPWQTLAECGACQGHFTSLLVDRFPGRQIIAFEPDRGFFSTLQERRLPGVAVVNDGLRAACESPVDVLFASSCVYYSDRVPDCLTRTPAKYVVLSHELKYHQEVIEPLFAGAPFALVARRSLPPVVEKMHGLLEIRYGTDVIIYERR